MVLVASRTETLREKGKRRKRWMNVGFQSPAVVVALEGNDQPGTLVAEPCMYRALCGLAGLQWPCRKPSSNYRQEANRRVK